MAEGGGATAPPGVGPMSPLAHAEQAADRLLAALAEWTTCSRAASTALDSVDEGRLLAALAERESLRPRIERAVGELEASRRSLAGSPEGAAGLRTLARRVPLAQIESDLREDEERLRARIESSRQELQRALDQLEQRSAAASAYRQVEEPEVKSINLLR